MAETVNKKPAAEKAVKPAAAKEKQAKPAKSAAAPKAPKGAAQHPATGRRKKAIARVRIVTGSGVITVNKRPLDEYFALATYRQVVRQPLVVCGCEAKYDIFVNLNGGGQSGQAGAVRHGIARSLVKVNEADYKKLLKTAGLLTRDPRAKERKKYGLHKARKASQFSKR